MSEHVSTPPADVISKSDLEKLFAWIGEIKFGTVTLILQDGKVVQVDKTEKIRFNTNGSRRD
ncbi:hypothetical protein FACS1894217_14750 [Clostridia bacterium]|nr:hypothetical protein FACS1894217_14750 [Clostridia bacterium]